MTIKYFQQQGKINTGLIAAFVIFIVITVIYYARNIFESTPGVDNFVDHAQLKKEETQLVSTTQDLSKAIDTVNVKVKVDEKYENHQLSEIYVSERDHEIELMLKLSSPTRYAAKRSIDGNEYKIILYGTTLSKTFSKSEIKNKSILSAMNTIQEDDNLIVDLDISEASIIKQISYRDDQKAIVLTLRDKSAVESTAIDGPQVVSEEGKKPETVVITKNEVSLTKEQLAEQNYQAAIDAANQGDFAMAIDLADKALSENPAYHDARKIYILAAFQTGQDNIAIKALEEGLRLAPEYSPFVKIKARLLIQENRAQEALAMLDKIKPEVDKDPEHYAFIAALYQDLGQYDQAVQLYNQLLAIQPYNSVWWAGLAVSIDAKGHAKEALIAFEKARELGGLDVTLSEYVYNRIETLKSNLDV